VKEDAKGYTMEVAAPGIRKEFCRVHVTNDGNLQIAIENKMEHKQDEREEGHKERYLRREFYYSNYQQTFRLPENVDADNISAQVADGILSITLPKRIKEAEEKAHRAIEVK
jgi:HSP20 family protein